MKLFKRKKNIPNEPYNVLESEQMINKAVELLLIILENLGFLNSSTIEEKIDEIISTKNYDKSIFYRLRISSSDNDYKLLEERFPASSLGYGELKLKKLKEKYLNLAKKYINEEKSSTEIIEELIFEVKLEISRYEKILKDFNKTVKDLVTNEGLSDIETIVMIDYWTTYYKEEKLGFPSNLKQKLVSLIENLKRLEYGGYGEKEIDKFLEKCKEVIKNLKKENASNEEIINYIGENIYNPLRQKYEKDLIILRKRISLVESSEEMTDNEKEIEKEKFIIDFNERNGHQIDLSSQLLEMKNTLNRLKYSEKERNLVDWFMNRAQDIIIKEKKNNKSDKLILAIIRIEYERYLSYYSNRLEKLERQLQRTDRKEKVIADFTTKTNLSFDLASHIGRMINSLKNLGILSDEEIIIFKNKCQEIERESIFTGDKEKALAEMESIYENIIEEKELTEQRQLEEITTKVSTYSKELSILGNIGYNENAVNEFTRECQEIIASKNTFDEKVLIINRKYKLLKENFYDNLKIFTVWRNEQIKKNPNSKEEIESIIKHLLTLSPKELQLYYEEDDMKKRQIMENHNNRLLVKYLANEEARKKANPSIVDERMEALSSGFIPYIAEELERAREELEKIEYLDEENNLPKEERLMTMVEYIDSTLFKQLSNIKLADLKNKKI